MKKIARLRFLGAVMAATPVLALTGSALAQYRVDDSHANDANNRIGSGGYNNAHDLTPRNLSVSGNDIISGNVSGNSFFRGVPMGTDDPNFFRAGVLSPTLDRFNAISAPVNYGQRSTGASAAQVYYNGDTQSTAPPPNFVSQVGSSGYTPPAAGSNQNQMYDARLGYNGQIGAVNSPADQTFKLTPGEFDLPGPTDTSGNATTLTASPIYGIRDWRMDDSSSQYFLSQYSNVRVASPSDRDRVSNAAIQQMRSELNKTVLQGPDGQTPDNPANGQNPNNATNANPNNLVASAIGTTSNVQNGALPAHPLGSSLNTPPLNGDLTTDQSTQQTLTALPAPDKQSSQILELETRRKKLIADSKTKLDDVQASQRFNEQLKYKKDVEAAKTGASGATGTIPGAGAAMGGTSTTRPTGMGAAAPAGATPGAAMPGHVAPNTPAPTTPAPALKPVVTAPLHHDADEQPYVVTSLATGIRASGLADLMKTAENQMRQGHFNSALDSYDAAEQVAPNNPFISLGRGFAELGASYYGKAENDIRRSVTSEPALLAGKYDLKGFLGEDRLSFVIKDLSDIYQSEKDSARPALLLGFIYHNQGDNAAAANYLSAADQRSSGHDPAVKLMREEWGFTPRN
jgi:tetratricopeptide (TPR) repeat protein